jgi:hypothetical protein
VEPVCVPPVGAWVAGLAAGAGLDAGAAGLLGAGAEGFFSWATAASETANKRTIENSKPRSRLLLPLIRFIFEPPRNLPRHFQNQVRAMLPAMSPADLSADRQRVAAECERALPRDSSSCDGITRSAAGTCRDHGSCLMMNLTVGMLFPKEQWAANRGRHLTGLREQSQ